MRQWLSRVKTATTNMSKEGYINSSEKQWLILCSS